MDDKEIIWFLQNHAVGNARHNHQVGHLKNSPQLPGYQSTALLSTCMYHITIHAGLKPALECSTCWLMLSDSHSLLALFASRAASMGGFTVLFIVTPEMYPTKIRSFALGLNNSMSRLGAILSPLVSVGLTKSGHLGAAEGIIAACCTVAAICICCLPKETPGRSLEVRKWLLAPGSQPR